jgi:hypothetical protein
MFHRVHGACHLERVDPTARAEEAGHVPRAQLPEPPPQPPFVGGARAVRAVGAERDEHYARPAQKQRVCHGGDLR